MLMLDKAHVIGVTDRVPMLIICQTKAITHVT